MVSETLSCRLWKSSQRDESVENEVFLPSPRKERRMVWRDTSLEGRGFEFLMDYNWIKKGCRGGPWGGWAAVGSSVIFFLWL